MNIMLKIAVIFLFFFFPNILKAQVAWKEIETDHFKIIYSESHSHIIPKVAKSAENALSKLMEIFDYFPSEKIVINTYDIYDYGFGTATSVPQNFIRLEIEPFEPSYEIIPYNDRLQWIISHELVHIIVNDQESDIESVARSIFSKVAPEQIEPVTIFYSLLTNYNRYSPRWHQEAIAVFMETWLSGGFGRLFSNFCEMYFRTLVLDNKNFPDIIELDALTSHDSFLLETIFYLYGTRFANYLTVKYDVWKFIEWFKQQPSDFYSGFLNEFRELYGLEFNEAWQEFISYEKEFQQSNISKLEKSPVTPVKRITKEPFGWVSQPYFNQQDSSVIFAFHRAHQLAGIKKYYLNTNTTEDIGSLASPSMHQVASTAFDNNLGLFFFTTNNNMLYRDLRVLDVKTKEEKLLFENQRIGHLTVSPVTHELWGIQHTGGRPVLVYSGFPYHSIQPVVGFNVGDEIYQLSVSNSGNHLAAILHRASGEQEVILVDCENLKTGGDFNFRTISDMGSPENVSWSSDDMTLYWNAYINGVSNIYRTGVDSSLVEAMSHTIKGLFKPVQIDGDSLFAFEYSNDGFIPVIIPIEPVEYLPAIEYMGQRILDKNPVVTGWMLKPVDISNNIFFKEKEYKSFSNIGIISFIPVVTGFQRQKVIGFFTHLSDPLIDHDIILEFGYSPFNEQAVGPKWHVRVKYDYQKRFLFGFDHNATDFYDLFNQRKRGMIGTKLRFGHLHYWVYDNPLKIKQASEISIYTGVEFINDNLVRVSQPDFVVAQTEYTHSYLRRTIGSSGYESGSQFGITFRIFGSDPENPKWAGQINTEWEYYNNFVVEHNTLHFKLGAGYHYDNTDLRQARFYFGGFGNREVENVDVKQFRSIFRFPGIPMYSLSTTRFLKVMLEDNLPPLRFSGASLGQHYLNHIDISFYSQALFVNSPQGKLWYDVGAQINFIFKHWFNLESTFSAGIAKAWWNDGNSWEGFLSIKFLKN